MLRAVAVIFCCLQAACRGGQWERAVLDHLFADDKYSPHERPVEDESEPLQVTFGIILQQIIDVDERSENIVSSIWLRMDEKNQIIHMSIWPKMSWNAYNLRWDKEKFGNVSSINMPKDQIWVPDILMYNSASDDFDETYPTKVVVTNDGNCLWVPPGMFKSTCAIDITWFPFDDQQCMLKFGSWTLTGGLLNLTQDQTEGGDTSSFIRNGEWMLIDVPVKRNAEVYACCPEEYQDLTFTIHIRRRTLYYGFNIVIPCVLISSLTLLLFILPPDAGEKISLGVTILLSLMVFLLLVAETMPPTSDAVPLIGIYFVCIMVMCSMSIIFTVGVLNFHYRSPDTHIMPSWIKHLICGWLAWLLRMHRPGGANSRRALLQRSQVKDYKLAPLEEKSRSLMANVLDTDDDPRTMASNGSGGFRLKMEDGCSSALTSNGGCVGSLGSGIGSPLSSTTVRHDITSILRELKKITAKFRKEEEQEDAKNDWKFAAMVMDRLFFLVCFVFTMGSTIAILASAPHLIT